MRAQVARWVLGSIVLTAGLIISHTTYTKLSGGLSIWETDVTRLKALPLFAWHPLLLSVGLLVLGPLAWAVIAARRNCINKRTRWLLAWTHTVLVALALAAAGGGLWAIYRNKEINHRPHLRSYHSWAGAASAVLLLAAAQIACLNLVNRKTGEVSVSFNSWWHRWAGRIALAASGFAAATGLWTGFGKSTWAPDIRLYLSLAVSLPQVSMGSILLALDVTSHLSASRLRSKSK